MSEKPRLSGVNLAAVAIVGLIGLTCLGLMAMYQGIDGAVFAGVVGGISAIVAAALTGAAGFIVKGK